jgi:23S rRNA G2069 N7-methylase RlmK/C1962 C5-methylase RlmI
MLARVGEPLGDSRDLARLLDDRIRTAQKLRSAVGLPSPDTNCYRLVNGEGDLLSGLCVDVFGDTLSVASSALWVEVHREAIVASLTRSFGPDAQIVWKKSTGRLQQDGWPLVHATDGMESDEQEGEADDSPEDESQLQRDFSPITVTECGIKFKVQPWSGQKTGFYCDQRDNRQLLRGLCAGRSVLDVFCYTGGFGLTAAAGGASSVTAVDSSQGAVDLGKQNAALNGLTGAHFIKDDALQFMKRAATEGQKFDIVVLDPPKLAPNKKALPRATRKYTQLNAAAIKLVKENGLLLTFSCSSAMAQSGTFLSTVEAAASNVGRTITVLKTVGQACDHPVLVQMPESSYLTGALFSCGAEIEIQAGPPHSLSESAGRLSSQAEGSTNRRATRQRSP